MQGATVALAESGAYPLLDSEYVAQRCPAFVDTVGLEFAPHGLDRLIGQHGDEQVSFSPILLVMVDRT